MNREKSSRWFRKKRAKFLARLADSTLDAVTYSVLLSDDKNVRTKFLLLGNFGLFNGIDAREITKILNNEYVRILLPFCRHYSVIEMLNEEQSLNCFTRIMDRKASNEAEVFPFFLQSMPIFQTTNVIEMQLPGGLTLQENFLNEEQESLLVKFVDSLCTTERTLKQRRVWHFGFIFDYTLNQVSSTECQPLPEFCREFLFKQLLEGNIISEEPDQMTINDYEPGDGIPYHVESHCFGEEIVSLSLLSPIVMDLRLSTCEENRRHVSLVLNNRSALVMSGESRHKWEHGIASRKCDVIVEQANGCLVNAFHLPSDEPTVTDDDNLRFGILNRQRRISLTFRKVVQTSVCHERVPSRLSATQNCLVLEQTYVKDVYELVASDFSSTRHTPWPKVADFVRSLPEGSLMADIGCGNGRYFKVSSDIFILGGDFSENLLHLASLTTPHCGVLVADCCNLPFQSNSIDAAICIAVIHHLATDERRRLAIDEIYRILRPSGRGLISVWAVEQSNEKTGQASTYTANAKSVTEENKLVRAGNTMLPVHKPRTPFKADQQDCFVPWKKDSLRYYHVFRRGELEGLFSHLDGKFTFIRNYFDEGNWCVEFEKGD